MINKLFLLVLFTFIFLFPASSQGASVTDPEELNKMMELKCGVAIGATPEQRQCCTANVKSLFETQHNQASDVLPSSIRTFFDSIFTIAMPIVGDNPLMSAVSSPCYYGVPQGEGASCKCVAPDKEAPPLDDTKSLTSLCESYINAANAKHSDAEKKQLESDRNACIKCAVDQGGLYSDLGCIPGDISNFVSNFVLRIGIGIAGFISLMCIIYSSFLIQVSRGNPEMITKAREQVTSCIIGLIMIIFSVFILRLIGVDILRIPGFS